MLETSSPPVLRYASAFLLVALAAILTHLLWPLVDSPPTSLFFAAVLIIAWYGGRGPGLLATVLSALVIESYFEPPPDRFSFDWSDFVRIAVFVLTALLINWLSTGRKRALATLRRRERELTDFVENAAVGLHWVGPDGRILWANKAELEIVGYPAEEYIGHHISEFHADKEVIDDILTRLTNGEMVNEYEARLRRRDGAIRHVLISSNVYWEGDRFVHTKCFTRDITARKQAEETAALLALIVESSDDAIISKDLAGVITSWNRGAEELYGYSAAEAVGKPISIIIPPERLDETTEILEKIKRGERIEHFETVRVTRDGKRVDVSLTVSPIRDSLGRIIGASKIARDITERKRGEKEHERLLEQEQQARAAAEEASRLKDEFLATVSHELRTPLTAIVGWTHMLQRNQLDEEGAAKALNTIERNARSQTQLIGDLLDVSRIITGKLRLDVRPFEPSSVIEAAIEALRPAGEAKKVRIQKVMDTGVGMISGDPNRLQQVVWNLLSNAIKFTPKGGRVQVMLQRVNSHVEISVSDTGVGIKPEFLPFVFDRFRQADGTTTRVHGGLGLGLAIVRHLVEMHGGTVTAVSPGENQGATFIVKLPLLTVYPKLDGQERVHPRASDRPLPLDCPESLEGMKVLVVDDEPDTRDLLKVVLGQCGAQVVTAGSSGEALELLATLKPDVLVSDIGMPGEDGYELIRKVRALPAESGGRTPAVALTAYARSEDRLRVLRSGYQMHVPKPVEVPELVAILANLAER